MKAKIQILANTNYPLAKVLKSELMENTQSNMAVAFLRKSGIDQIYDAIEYSLTKKNALLEIVVGLDFKNTDYNALKTLLEIKRKYKRFSFYCFGDKRDNFNDLIFHPKIYLFCYPEKAKYTSIIGSSNLTAGGLATNFEVNIIIEEEEKPRYFSQLHTIYNEIKFNDSVFCPDERYLEKYYDVKRYIDKSEGKLEKSIKEKIKELKTNELKLPGPGPTIKRIIINIIKQKQKEGLKSVPLKVIYEEAEKIVKEQKLIFKMDTFRNSIRGELNKHAQNSKHPDSMSLFVRLSTGHYILTDNGERYEGR